MREKLKLQKRHYFIDAAVKILKNEGLERFNARKVAAETGYNVASIYTYFKNLDHLENVASIYFTNEYAHELNEITKYVNTPLESYLAMWELFAKHTFYLPNYFYNVFFSAISQDEEINLFSEYYAAHPEELPYGGMIADMLEISRTNDRERYVLEKCVEAKQINVEMVDYISDIHIYHFKCIVTDIVKSQIYQPSPQLYHDFMVKFCYSFLHYVDSDARIHVEKLLRFHQENMNETYLQLYNIN